jgi:hypothetical protein
MDTSPMTGCFGTRHSSGLCREAFPCAAPADLLVRWNIGHEIALSDEEDDEEATTT